MKIELQIIGYVYTTSRFFREWTSPPRIGELVHVRELAEPEKHGLTPEVAESIMHDMRVHNVWWGPFAGDLYGVDVIVKLLAVAWRR